MKKLNLLIIVLSLFLIKTASLQAQDIIEVSIQGISDGIKNSKRRDRDEAIMDAKLQAVEKAGLNIKSVTEVENFMLKKDWIQSKAEASLMPGFKILDIGYGEDGLYRVVLIGKIRISDDNAEMIFIEGGAFLMGCDNWHADEKPVHKVYVDDFYMDKYEVTNKQYCKFLNRKGNQIEDDSTWLNIKDNKCHIVIKNGYYESVKGYSNHPVTGVTWYGARAYTNWVGKRLPTEAEWEYACSGGNKSKGYIYSGSNNVDEVAYYRYTSGGRSDINTCPTCPIGTKKANELGIYDMSGNVWEWCADWYSKDYYSKSVYKNPDGPSSGKLRVIRGDSWYGNHSGPRCTLRVCQYPNSTTLSTGFRCVRDLIKD